ncbi:putative methyltransferase-domain-containing protein [Aspergillus parasiticus]|uniref:Protein-lysine N-methyltransferase EFM6 n=2 Tax=Aspergillus subgen. Circumdati TaxID=2720871 RepID=A0A5N6D355_ASPPA|nr:putative methyltransferase-domain-containing protein [Aspergillus parasiticus]KAE8307420.1 putative methyltransferase-domain-containing protein [Aspergillus transmontanensis]
MMETSNSPDQQSVLSESLHVSESLVPARDLKGVGHAEISFDGLLKDPLIIKEDLKEGCGGQLWPAGMVLARYLLHQHRSDFNNKTIVELGAGGGLVGLAVARGCDIGSSSVYITDQAPMLPLMEANIKLNNVSSRVAATVLNWGESLPDCIPKHPAIVLAADCVYFEPAFPLLISTLKNLLGPESICYFCFKRRRRADSRFLKLAKKLFHIVEVCDDPMAETYKRENIFLYSIRSK